MQGSLHIVGDEGFQNAIRAKVVDRYADPAFWEKWATTIREIAIAHENRIRALLRGRDARVRETFNDYLQGIRDNLNDGITEERGHRDAFPASGNQAGFRCGVSVTSDLSDRTLCPRAMQSTIDALDRHGLGEGDCQSGGILSGCSNSRYAV